MDEGCGRDFCQMRAAGATWEEIGRTLRLSRNTVIERGRRLRATAPLRAAMPVAREVTSDDQNWAPLPPGIR
jgi:hypothetical protein